MKCSDKILGVSTPIWKLAVYKQFNRKAQINMCVSILYLIKFIYSSQQSHQKFCESSLPCTGCRIPYCNNVPRKNPLRTNWKIPSYNYTQKMSAISHVELVYLLSNLHKCLSNLLQSGYWFGSHQLYTDSSHLIWNRETLFHYPSWLNIHCSLLKYMSLFYCWLKSQNILPYLKTFHRHKVLNCDNEFHCDLLVHSD